MFWHLIELWKYWSDFFRSSSPVSVLKQDGSWTCIRSAVAWSHCMWKISSGGESTIILLHTFQGWMPAGLEEKRVTSEEHSKARELISWEGSRQKLPKDQQVLGGYKSCWNWKYWQTCTPRTKQICKNSTMHTGVSRRMCNLDHSHGSSACCAQMMTAGLYMHLTETRCPWGPSEQLCRIQHNSELVNLQLGLASPLLLQQGNCEWMYESAA